MRVAIVGSRDFPVQSGAVAEFVRKLAVKYPDALVVSGGARGVDRAAECAAMGRKLRVKSYRPFESQRGDFGITIWMSYDDGDPWECVEERFTSYGQAAFFRNRLIVDAADVVVAFWDGSSRGTRHSMEYAESQSKPVHVYR